jgi:hypothetical protein
VAQVEFSAKDFCFGQVQVLIVSANKPVEIALVDDVLIDQLQMSYSEAGQEVGGGASNATSSNNSELGRLKSLQSQWPDLGDGRLSGKIVQHFDVHSGAK